MSDSEEDQELSREAAERAAAAARLQERSMTTDLQILRALRRGEVRPGPDAGQSAEPTAERERVTVLPPSLALRKEDAELDDQLDRYTDEDDVRKHVEDFNERVAQARGPMAERPSLTTMPRDVESTVDAWRERYAAFRSVPRIEPAAKPAKRHWWNRLSRRR